MEEHKAHAKYREVLKVYWDETRKHPVLLTLIGVGMLTFIAANLIAPLYLRTFFNLLATHNADAATVALLISTLSMVALFWFGDWLARRIQDTATGFLETRVMADLTTKSFAYLLRHSYNFFVSNFAGSLTHKVNKFGRSYETVFDAAVGQFIPTFIFVLGAIGVLFTKNAALGALLAGWTVIFVAFQLYIARIRQPIRAKRAEADTKVTGTIADAIGNHSTIMLFSATVLESKVLADVVETWRKATVRLWNTDGWIWACLGLLMLGIEVALLYGAVIYWQQGLLTVGDFVLIQAYLITTFERLIAINRQLRAFYSAMADASEMVSILSLKHEVKDRAGAKQLQVGQGEVWFDNVNFWFSDKRKVLTDFNLTIAGSERVALVGPSGAGKSTVTKLLLRMYDLQEGEIKIDKADIATVTQDSLREHIGFVPQEPILFHRTLMENIRYGRRSATDQEVLDAARRAHCHEFISALPQGYDTFVGERGIKLSGGERQRVAIARAILKNAPILVLDEATSSLDSESEALIQDALDGLMRGKTVIVIAHRLSTIMKMDRIVVMEKGAIVAQGTHLELIREKGLYQRLWSIQAGGFIGDGEGGKTDDEQAAPLLHEDELTEESEEK